MAAVGNGLDPTGLFAGKEGMAGIIEGLVVAGGTATGLLLLKVGLAAMAANCSSPAEGRKGSTPNEFPPVDVVVVEEGRGVKSIGSGATTVTGTLPNGLSKLAEGAAATGGGRQASWATSTSCLIALDESGRLLRYGNSTSYR